MLGWQFNKHLSRPHSLSPSRFSSTFFMYIYYEKRTYEKRTFRAGLNFIHLWHSDYWANGKPARKPKVYILSPFLWTKTNPWFHDCTIVNNYILRAWCKTIVLNCLFYTTSYNNCAARPQLALKPITSKSAYTSAFCHGTCATLLLWFGQSL